MTYRERREAKAARLREWSAKREAKAEAASNAAHALASQIPFGQPILVGHHSEKAHRRADEKIRAGFTRAMEHDDKAVDMARRADGIEAQAARAIYSDDPDALEQLREKLAGLEAERARIKAYNASCRKAAKAGGVGDRSLLDDKQRASLLSCARAGQLREGTGAVFPSYASTNLGGNIARIKQRIADVERRAETVQ